MSFDLSWFAIVDQLCGMFIYMDSFPSAANYKMFEIVTVSKYARLLEGGKPFLYKWNVPLFKVHNTIGLSFSHIFSSKILSALL